MHKTCSITVWMRAAVAAVACVPWAASGALAQSYPSKPLRVIVGFPAGSGADFVARIVGQRLSGFLGQPVIVENRTGAAGTIATGVVATSVPDGYTFLQVTAAEAAQPALRPKLPYSLERDFAPISLEAIGTFVLVVHPSVPVLDIRQLIALAHARPGELNYGSSGAGSSPHLAVTLLQQMAKIKVVEVPYKGATESVTATVTGEVDFSLPSITAALPLMESGRVRVLAVTSNKRAALLPKVPTISESGLPGFDRSTWHGLLAPGGTPREIITTLNGLVVKIVNTQEVRDLFGRQGLEAQTNTPEQYATLIKNELAQVARLIRSTGVKPK